MYVWVYVLIVKSFAFIEYEKKKIWKSGNAKC